MVDQTFELITKLYSEMQDMRVELRSEIRSNSERILSLEHTMYERTSVLFDAVDLNRQGIERNAQAIERNAQAIERNAQAIDRNAQAIDRNAQAIDRNAQAIDRNAQAIDRNAQAIEFCNTNLSLLTDKVDQIAKDVKVHEIKLQIVK